VHRAIPERSHATQAGLTSLTVLYHRQVGDGVRVVSTRNYPTYSLIMLLTVPLLSLLSQL